MSLDSILFVCLGNICRSPLAEGIARDLSLKNNWNLKIDSAGTSGFHRGSAPHERSIKVAKKYSIDIANLKSRQINYNDDKDFSLIITMDSSNKHNVLALGFDLDKVFKLGDFGSGEDVPDPYYFKNDAGFEEVFNMILRLEIEMFKKYGLLK